MKHPPDRVVVVGGGMAGLTAAAYLLRDGFQVRVLEKSGECGGHVASFTKDGFLFDTGPRAIGNAGILKPLIEDFKLDVRLVEGRVSTGIREHIVHHDTDAGIDHFLQSLRALFPDSTRAIGKIDKLIRASVKRARLVNRMPNPYFRKILGDPKTLFTEFLPRLPGFLAAVVWMHFLDKPMERVLSALSSDRALNDMISQHFFRGTPSGFMFGYFENFQDYQYPLGGTGRLPAALVRYVLEQGGSIETRTEITRVNPGEKTLKDRAGNTIPYDHLVWCADLNSLYPRVDLEGLRPKVQRAIIREHKRFAGTRVGESVYSIFLAVDEDPAVFGRISRGHFIYTPRLDGLGELHRGRLDRIKADFSRLPKREVLDWLADFCRFNSYEISIPVLKDPRLAPPRQTGLIISLLFDGELFELIQRAGWYDEFKRETTEAMLDALDASIYPGLRKKILFHDAATPLTLMNRFNTTHGAITGWSMEEPSPVPYSLFGIMQTPKTAIPGVWKAGQWSYSPAGVPVAILTGRIAAAAILASAPRRPSSP